MASTFQDSDILSYKALKIKPDLVYRVLEDSSLVSEGTGVTTTYNNLINNVTKVFPSV